MTDQLITNELLDNLDYSCFKNKCATFDMDYHFFAKKSGECHYRLLSFLSTFFKDSIISDIGTSTGASALALSYNQSNKIYSFDVKERNISILGSLINQPVGRQQANFYRPDNVSYVIGDYRDFDYLVLSSKLILFDTTHNGEDELKFHNFLKNNYYEGMVIYDDIHLNSAIQSFWDKIEEYKKDWTCLGNPRGTGLVIYQ